MQTCLFVGLQGSATHYWFALVGRAGKSNDSQELTTVLINKLWKLLPSLCMKYFLIVVYKQKITESRTFLSLVNQVNEDCCVIIRDNSPPDFDQDDLNDILLFSGNNFRIEYWADGINLRLSSIYNKCCNYFLEDDLDLIVILDQDTLLNDGFVIDLDFVLGNDFLVVPKVKSLKNKVSVSPRQQSKISLSNKVEVYSVFDDGSGKKSSKNLFAVGSGMVITRPLWELGIRFDERVTFYGVDTEFCLAYQKLKDHFFMLDSVLYHDISEEANEPVHVRKYRVRSHMAYWRFQLINHSKVPRIVAIFLTNFYFLRFLMKNNSLRR